MTVANKDLLKIGFIKTNLKDTKFNFNNTQAVVNTEFNIDLDNDLLFELELKDNSLNFWVRYKKAKLSYDLINYFINSYKILYNSILNEISTYPEKSVAHELLEAQAADNPNKIAIVYENTKFTYFELNNQANKLASYLRYNYKTQGDDLIALYLDRSEHIIVGIFAILKSGAAYVPIDPNAPDERIYYILKDTDAKAIISLCIYS